MEAKKENNQCLQTTLLYEAPGTSRRLEEEGKGADTPKHSVCCGDNNLAMACLVDLRIAMTGIAAKEQHGQRA